MFSEINRSNSPEDETKHNLVEDNVTSETSDSLFRSEEQIQHEIKQVQQDSAL